MKSVGIIAEYNPFHKGHEYQLARAKELSGAEVSVVVMSGDFVQRGEPAIIDKFTRAGMALEGGADLVLELPLKYAVASAENFAFGAVGLLHFLGVDALCFGSESGDLDGMERVAQMLAEEPDEYKELLKEKLSCGNTYPQARAFACTKLLGEAGGVLETPNDILGVEYIKAYKRLNASMRLHAVTRVGAEHNQENAGDGGFASATAIRRFLWSGEEKKAFECMPPKCAGILMERIRLGGLATVDDFSGLLNYKIYSIMRDDSSLLMNYADVGESLANRISKLYGGEHFDGSVSELIVRLKTREMTYSRISRALMHILLDIYVDAYQTMTPYARVLAADEAGRAFLRGLKAGTSLPVIARASDGTGYLEQDIYASTVYNLVIKEKHGVSIADDYRMRPIIKTP